ncbi:Yip1 family protein [Kitasatospora kifunensis]|uniref:Yip1 domain-containing protein n=1 Tax=Kitasatospora kifunensis TaxID=58351 RepID=A0A7W7VVN5_KITKI|nr:Yip1 family protein [Kitasatospora kifunensis]MBB4924571.1 hypothetical protein [Kitasatospora kifunensis]
MAGNGYPNGWGDAERDRAAQARTQAPYGSYGSYDSRDVHGSRDSYNSADSHGPYGSRDSRDSRDSYGEDPYRGDQPGHTRAFPVGEQGYGAYGGEEQQWTAQPPRERAGAQPQPQPQSPDHVATYRAGGRTAPRVGGPRLRWRELLIGIYRTPARTFDQMRDHQVWLSAVTISLLYAVLAVLGFGDTHDEVVNSTFSIAAWSLGGAAIAFTVAGLMLGAVTYALARQLGGDGPWASTVGLSVLIGWTSDVPRLLLALFLPSDNLLVQAVGWVTWLFCAVLMTTMIRRVHDLPWGKAAGAVSLQLLALLVLIKLPTLG